MGMSLTEQAARLSCGIEFDRLPPQAIETAKIAFIDCLGVALAGAETETGRIVARYAGAVSGDAPSTVIGSGLKSSPEQAALANGTMAHALDYDDFSPAGWHPSSPVVPAVLALAEALDLSGSDALEAYVAGSEVGGRLGPLMKQAYRVGWHATGTLGCLGAAAAASRLLSLPPEQTRMALGIVSSMASGLRRNFGSMTKPLHSGIAARSGITAALLARSGFTGDGTILESDFGFISTLNGQRPDSIPAVYAADRPLVILSHGLWIKKYACCGATHPAVDAVLALAEKHSIRPADVAQIRCGVHETVPSVLIHSSPKTGMEGKFSLQYCTAVALVDHGAGVLQFSDERLSDPLVRSLTSRVEMYVDQALGPQDGIAPVSVTIILSDGRRFSEKVTIAKGDPRRPMTPDEVAAKYRECAGTVLPSARVEESLGMLWGLEKVARVRTLMDVLGRAKAK